jgi:protease-4
MDLKDEVHLQQLVDDVYEQFVADIADARGIEKAAVEKLADGRVFTGRQAKDLKLVDELGSFQDAIEWVADEADLKGDPKVVYPPEDVSFLDELVRGGVRSFVEETKATSAPVLEYRYLGPQ